MHISGVYPRPPRCSCVTIVTQMTLMTLLAGYVLLLSQNQRHKRHKRHFCCFQKGLFHWKLAENNVPTFFSLFFWRWWRWLWYTLTPYPKNTVIIVTSVTPWLFCIRMSAHKLQKQSHLHSFSSFRYNRDDSDDGDALSDIGPIIWKHRHTHNRQAACKSSLPVFCGVNTT